MRRFLLFLMIMLLPLRGWAGDLMGIEMAMLGGAVSVESFMPPDCPMHLQAQASTSDVDDLQAQSDMAKCASCQLCIALAAMAVFPLDAATPAVHAQPLMGGVVFDSTLPDLRFKPPIS